MRIGVYYEYLDFVYKHFPKISYINCFPKIKQYHHKHHINPCDDYTENRIIYTHIYYIFVHTFIGKYL